jgi:hypothetical protein
MDSVPGPKGPAPHIPQARLVVRLRGEVWGVDAIQGCTTGTSRRKTGLTW